MAFPVQNAQVVATALAKFTSRFSVENAPNLRKLAACYLAGVQELENAIWATLEGRFLANAVGVDLAVIGDLVGQPNTGLDDDTYRAAIRLRIKANRSQGRAEDVLKIAVIGAKRFSADLNGLASYFEAPIMAFSVTVANQLYPALLASILSEARAIGSHGTLIYSTWPDGEDFDWGSIYDPRSGQQGYGSVYSPSAGGPMVSSFSL